MKKYIPILLAATVLSFTACQKTEKPKTEEEHHSHAEGEEHAHDHEGHEHKEGEEAEEVELGEAQFRSAGIVLGVIEKRALSGTIQVTGTLTMPPQQQISVSFPYGGIVKHTSLLPGKWVSKGEVLLTLENPEFITLQQDFLEAQTQLTYSEKEFKRQEELSRENVAAAKTFQRTSTDLAALKVRLDALRQKLALLHLQPGSLEKGILRTIPVTAPASGYVTEVNINTGKAVQPNEMLAELADTRFLQAELNVFEKDIPKLKTGQQVNLQLAQANRKATISLIGREISAERMVKVLCRLDGDSRELLPGTYCTATIETGATQVNTLPESAVVRSGDKQYVFVSEGQHKEEGGVHYPFRRVEVKTGTSQNGFTEVFLPDGFDIPGSKLVLKGAYDLLSKMNNSEHGHSH